jgi:hypothetical protein
MLHHQERVLVERAELDDKLNKLSAFLDGKVYPTLSGDEQRLLGEQYRHMVGYRLVLDQRIRMFKGAHQ